MQNFVMIFAMILLASCGIKGDPIRPGDTASGQDEDTAVIRPAT